MRYLRGNKPLAGLVFVSLLALLLGACTGENSNESAASDADRVVLVSTGETVTMDLPIWLESVGQVHSLSAPTLAAEVSGRITRVDADIGDAIAEGQLLAETDTSTLLLQQQAAKAAVERMQVHIATGEKRVDRLNTLSAKNLSSQTQLDDALEQLEVYRADYRAAVAQLAIVEDSLTKSRIIAPVSGVVQRRLITAGDFVSRGQPLFEITLPERLQAWLPYPETVALQIRIGQPARISSPLTPGVFTTGTISDLQPTIGSGSRAVMSIVDLDSPGQLRPGATITGEVLVETRKQAVLVPIISVVRRPAGELVYVISGNTAQARVVETGHPDGNLLEIVTGLKGGETIATDGAAFLTDGARVKIEEPVN
ncbi:MAG: efflux RND transporter periplasmic adaptor subunit [Lysobacterales bacterium]